MLIIDDSADGIPANVAAMTEKQILLGFLDTDAAGTGGDTIMSGTLDPTWTVNGLVGGTINAQLDTWQHWRVLVADPDAKTKLVEFGPECEVALLARDGVMRDLAAMSAHYRRVDSTRAAIELLADFFTRNGCIQVIWYLDRPVSNSGRLRGWILERAGAPPGAETADIRFDPQGNVTLSVGTKSQGQGHDTMYKIILSDVLGIDSDDVYLIEGDTDKAVHGTGTFGSRSASVGGSMAASGESGVSQVQVSLVSPGAAGSSTSRRRGWGAPRAARWGRSR